jgi:tetratricopeptide (TPR) repeat protein
MITPPPITAALLVAFAAMSCCLASSTGRPEVGDLLAKGFPASRDELARGLAAAWRPDARSGPGSPFDPLFTEWLDLWRWCRILSRDAAEENAALARRHFLREEGTGALFHFKPGQPVPPRFQRVPMEEARLMARDGGIRAALARSSLPPGARLASGRLSSVLDAGAIRDFLSDRAFSRALFSTVSEDDYLPAVLSNLASIRKAHPSLWREYRNLAVAIAVVSDAALPEHWPHHQVEATRVPGEFHPAAVQFGFWTAANASGELLHDLRELDPLELKHIVDAFLFHSELAQARRANRLRLSNFHRAYDNVRYREDRARGGHYIWKDGPYTMASILENGGICIDQAYHASMTGKALGIPTILFNGQGTHGGHAWFGYLRDRAKWRLDCGRSAGGRMVAGEALDPQTWTPVTDHELRQLASGFRRKPKFAASENCRAMAEIQQSLGRPAAARESLDRAIAICPDNAAAWDDLAGHLAATRAPAAERIAFHEKAARHFRRHGDLAFRHRAAISRLQRSSGDARAAMVTEKDMVRQADGGRTDLEMLAAAAPLRRLIASGDLDAAAKEFHRRLHAADKHEGGYFLKEVAVPFIEALLKDGQKQRALRTGASIRQRFNPPPGSPLDATLKRLEQACR